MAPISARTNHAITCLSVVLVCLVCVTSVCGQVLIGDLSELAHDVKGTVYAVNTRTLRIEGFTYDGTGPEAAFWLDTVAEATAAGVIPPLKDTCEVVNKLASFDGETVEIELPEDTTIADFRYFSIWCVRAASEFGGIEIDASALRDVPVLEEPACQARSGDTSMKDVFPVEEGWNCEPLSSDYQVRWQVDSGAEAVNFELVARLENEDHYMGFGPSGSDERTMMTGSDVAIAYRQGDESFAIDYFMSSQSPCSGEDGVCPDANTEGASNDITDVSGDTKEDLTMVRYSRPIAGSDAERDSDINLQGSSFVTWALGPLNKDTLTPLFHGRVTFPREDVSIEFGREVKNECAGSFTAPEEEVADAPPFERPVLFNVTEITARIGPSGGKRGVSAITQRPSWGIAWYMSRTGSEGEDVLIPTIGVERGKTYTFSIYGGVLQGPEDTSAHPMYITESSVGGFDRRSPQERAQETVYAGIDQLEKDDEDGIISYRATGAGELCEFESDVQDTTDVKTYEDYFKTVDTSCTKNETITENGGSFSWTVAQNTPDLVYYQCVTHELLGYKIRVFDEGKVDVDVLRELNDDVQDKTCRAEFKGETRTFGGCSSGLEGGMDLFWTFNEAGDEIETLFRIQQDEGYVGIGLGYEEMVGSDAVIAFDTDDGAKIGTYKLTAQNSEGVQPSDSLPLVSSDAERSGNTLSGLFTRKLEIDGHPTITKGNTPVIWAVGAKPGSATSLSRHNARSNRGTTIDLSQVAGDGADVSSGRRVETIFIVHASFMGVAWILLAPTAMLSIRYFKKYNPWAFQIHRALNMATAVLTTTAIILGLESGSRTERTHLIIGCIVFVLVIIQAAAGVFRPPHGARLRVPWFWAHSVNGSVLGGLALVNCFLGIRTEKIGGPIGWYIAVGVVAGGFLALSVVLAMMPGRFPRQVQEKKVEDDVQGEMEAA